MRKSVIAVIVVLTIIGLYARVVCPWLVDKGFQSDKPFGNFSDLMYFTEDDKYESKSCCSVPSVYENVIGAGLIIFNIAAPWLRDWRTSWGASPEEIKRYLPGDELVPEPNWSYTHAIIIKAPQTVVWPWIVQIGQKRGGFYSYQGLENLLGCQITNVNRPINKFQFMRPTDKVYLHPQAPPLTVRSMRRYYWFVLHGGNLVGATQATGNEITANLTWTFYLQKIDNTTTKLITRGRYAYGQGLVNSLNYGPYLIEPIAFVMERKMLQGIKRRAEKYMRY
ncbi:MAG: hypothetical protein KAK01_00895 [Candidatus Marinimicrobia bacterium]|nr:hypothetical protein [Candidatus Neomarinimicrobiota bacterium]